MLEQIPLVRLIPHDPVRLNRAEIQPADQIRRQQPVDRPPIVCERGDRERRTKALRNRRGFLRRHLYDRDKRKQELAVRERMIGVAADDGRQHVSPAVQGDDPLGPERVPPTERSEADAQATAAY